MCTGHHIPWEIGMYWRHSAEQSMQDGTDSIINASSRATENVKRMSLGGTREE